MDKDGLDIALEQENELHKLPVLNEPDSGLALKETPQNTQTSSGASNSASTSASNSASNSASDSASPATSNSNSDASDSEISSDSETDSNPDVHPAPDDVDEIPKTKNELEDPIQKVPDDLRINEETSVAPVGTIHSVGDRSVVIKANKSARYKVLVEGAVLVLADKQILGVLHETFGPIDQPFHVVKFHTDEELNDFKDKVGEEVFQVISTSKYALTDEFKVKGTDASNFNDEEVPLEEQEFSDDEAEIMARKKKKRKVDVRKRRAYEAPQAPQAPQAPPQPSVPPMVPPEFAQQFAQMQMQMMMWFQNQNQRNN